MKQTLQLKLTQHLTLTPQLQQSIRLLQLSTLELNAEVERMLQENPLLEKADGDDDARPAELPLAGPARAGEAEARGEAGEAGDDAPADNRPAADGDDAPSRPSVPITTIIRPANPIGAAPAAALRAATTTTATIRNRWPRPRCATTSTASSRCSTCRCATARSSPR